MSDRPTIADLAKAAGVSVSTVDRVVNGRDPVRKPTSDRVLQAAEAIGFHAASLIRQRLSSAKPSRNFGFLLLQKNRPFYQILAEALVEAARSSPLVEAVPKIIHVEDLDPGSVAEQIGKLGRGVDALAIVAANEPRIAAAIDALHAKGIASFALISELTAPCPVGYIGLDNYKAGRTAGWAIANLSRRAGKVAVIVGSHRFRCQDLNEMGFRSYFREHAPEFTLLEPRASLEDARYAAEVTRDLLAQVPDLSALYVAGGGVSGVLAALRERHEQKPLVTIAHDLTHHTKAGLIEGLVNAVIAHPMKTMAQTLVEAMANVSTSRGTIPPPQITLPFFIHTRENI